SCSRLRGLRVVVADHFGCGAHRIALRRAEERVPNVENQYGARRIRAVPGLVLDGVIEHPCLARYPLSGFVADSEAAIGGYDQGQVYGDPGVGDTGVRRDVCRGVENRKEYRGRARTHVA